MISVWQHKKTKKKFRATPWWEIPDAVLDIPNANSILNDKMSRQLKFGTLVQVGWLLENEHNIYIGLGLTAKKSFKDLGEWKPHVKKEPKK